MTTIREVCDFPGCNARSEKMRQWPNGERAFTCDTHAAGLGASEDAPVRAVPSPACEVCDRSGPAAKRCEFGHPSGPCSCWRGVPCGAPQAPASIPASLVSAPEARLNGSRGDA